MIRNRIAVALLSLALACGGSDGPSGPNPPPPPPPAPPPPPPPGNAPMTATIDGVAWASTAQVLSTYTPSSKTYTIVGAESAIGRALLITLMEVNGPGTFTLGTALPMRYANTTQGTNTWETRISGATGGSGGTVIVTVATPTRIAGTFSFVGAPASNSPNATGTKNVTNGAFDVAIP